MAEKSKYPKISRKIWWLLRNRLKQSMPGTITPTLVSSVSEMTDGSAKSNVLAPLREMRLLDENNKPTDLMERWRHDDEYPTVCMEIRADIYTPELIEAFPEPTGDHKERIKSWFMKNAKVGEPAAKMYTDTYLLLSERDPGGSNDAKPSSSNPTKAQAPKTTEKKQRTRSAKSFATKDVAQSNADDSKGMGHMPKKNFPSIHIDIQVHISPETSSEQIDKIFESMSKHLGTFVGE